MPGGRGRQRAADPRVGSGCGQGAGRLRASNDLRFLPVPAGLDPGSVPAARRPGAMASREANGRRVRHLEMRRRIAQVEHEIAGTGRSRSRSRLTAAWQTEPPRRSFSDSSSGTLIFAASRNPTEQSAENLRCTAMPNLSRAELVRDADSEPRTTTLELFYDLVFVFAITQVSHLLLDNLTWRGAGQAALILLVSGGRGTTRRG